MFQKLKIKITIKYNTFVIKRMKLINKIADTIPKIWSSPSPYNLEFFSSQYEFKLKPLIHDLDVDKLNRSIYSYGSLLESNLNIKTTCNDIKQNNQNIDTKNTRQIINYILFHCFIFYMMKIILHKT